MHYFFLRLRLGSHLFSRPAADKTAAAVGQSTASDAKRIKQRSECAALPHAHMDRYRWELCPRTTLSLVLGSN